MSAEKAATRRVFLRELGAMATGAAALANAFPIAAAEQRPDVVVATGEDPRPS